MKWKESNNKMGPLSPNKNEPKIPKGISFLTSRADLLLVTANVKFIVVTVRGIRT